MNVVSGDEYRYEHFRTRQLFHDLMFRLSALRAGRPFPDFDLETTTGERVRKKDFIHERPLLLITASVTCPNTQAAMPTLNRLYAQFGGDVAFVMVNVREAHPGGNYPQPASFDEKIKHARALQSYYNIPWVVAADDIDGGLDRQLDGKPNAAWIIDTDGQIIFRSHWAKDERGLRRALEAVQRGLVPPRPKSSAMVLPVARAMGHLNDVLGRAGPPAW
ncbi:MAG: TlpA family protein disulfide reductase, partial [Acidimicrobiia bacterium]